MQPINAEKSPKVHIPPLNHIGLWVDDIHLAVSDLTKQGVRFAPGGIRKGAGKHVCIKTYVSLSTRLNFSWI